MMEDLRFDNTEHLGSVQKMILAGEMTGRGFAAYAVEFRGAIVSCLAIERTPGEWVPLAILLPDEHWANVPQLSATHRPTLDWDGPDV